MLLGFFATNVENVWGWMFSWGVHVQKIMLNCTICP